MNINHNAIFALYPNAVSVTDINDTVESYIEKINATQNPDAE